MTESKNKQSYQIKLNIYIRDRVQKKLVLSGTTENYIKFCVCKNKTRKDSSNFGLERHHIIPRFAGGTNNSENIVLLTPRQHILVHLLRYLEFAEKQDFRAYVFRKVSEKVDLRSHRKKMAEYNKQTQTTFWDSKFQSEQGKKGGKKGGSAQTQLQQEARSKVGTTWGPIVGLANQSEKLKDALSFLLVFYHEEENVEILIPVCKSAAEVFDFLHNEVVALGKEHLFSKEFVNKAKSGGPMYDLIKGQKKKIYGWSIIERIAPEFD